MFVLAQTWRGRFVQLTLAFLVFLGILRGLVGLAVGDPTSGSGSLLLGLVILAACWAAGMACLLEPGPPARQNIPRQARR